MQCVSNLRPMLLEPSLKRTDFVTSASSYTNNSDVKPSVGQPSVSAFDWGSRTAVDDIILSRNSSKSVSSPSVLGLQLMINPAVRSAQTPPNVMTLSTRLYYDSVQLSNMSPRADDITPLSLVRHDSMDTGMDIAAMKTKKLEVDPNQDAEKAEIDEFLRVHCLRIAQGCRDVPVKELRHIIPILILRCFCMKGEQAQKKVKGLWERAPQGWPADVPYCDPNNAPLRSRSGEPIGTKPKKETLNQMFDFLIREYVAQNVDNSVNRLMDSTVAAKYINGQPSMPSSGHDGHVTSNWPMASSPMRISPPTSCWHQQAIASQPTTSSIARNHHVLHPSLSTYPTLSPPITYTSSQVITMPPLSQISSSQLQATAQQPASRKRPYDDVSRWPVSVSEADSTMRLSGSYDSASSPCSEGGSSGKGSMTDHMPPTVRCRDLEALAAAAATRRNVPCNDTTVPVFSPPSPPPSDASGPPPTISPPLAPSQSAVSPPAHMQPMTKKARLLAAVIPPMSPSQSEASDSNSSSSPVPAVSSTDAQVTNSPPLPPSPPSLRSHPINEQALNDIMIRIADKIKTLEQRQLASDRFGIIYVIKDLLWKMRTLLDISQYLPYLEKLHEMDCTLDAIGMLGVFPDSHFHRWQEFEDKWYIRVCGQTNNKSSTTFEAPTSFAQN